MASAPTRKYLLAIDGSDNANRAAEYVANRASKLGPCTVHMVHVQPPRLSLFTQQQHQLLVEIGSETQRARSILDKAGVACRLHSELGAPAERILEVQRVEACDEVVAGSRGMGALDNLSLGSVAYKIVHLSPVPVTVVPNPYATAALDLEDGEGVHRILLPVDGSAAAGRAVEYVCALRDAGVPVEVRLLNVQMPIASANVRRFVSRETIEAYQRAEGDAATASAIQSLEAAAIVFKTNILAGHAAQAIVREALHWGCTRIVMGTRGHGALANVLVGSTALRVMHLSEIPVTLVK